MHCHRNCRNCRRQAAADARPYRIPPQRPSNEPDGTTGVAPVIMPDPWAGGGGSGNGEAARGAEFDGVVFAGVEPAGDAVIWATSVCDCGFAAAGCGLVTAWTTGFAGGTEA